MNINEILEKLFSEIQWREGWETDRTLVNKEMFIF